MKKNRIIYITLIVVLITGFIIWIILYNPSTDVPLKTEKNKSGKKIAEQKIDIDTLKTKTHLLYNKFLDNHSKVKTSDIKIRTIKPKDVIDIIKIKKENTVKDTLTLNTPKSKTSSELPEQIITVEAKKTPPVISEIPIQLIYKGEKFPSVDLKLFVIDSEEKSENIRWEIIQYKNLDYEINPCNRLEIKLPSEDWTGTDTLFLIAFNSSNLSTSTKIIFEVREIDLINRYPIKQVKDVLILGVEDALSLVVNPLKWDSDDFVITTSIITGTLLLTIVDKEIQQQVVESGSYENNTLMKFGKFYGESYTSQIAGLGITFCGIAANDKKITRLGLEVFESYVIADRLNFLLKFIFGRERPSENKGDLTFSIFSGRANGINSLPSGHATLAFSLSTVLSSCTDNDYLKALIYAPAFLTAASRVYQNFHWTSDVFLGGALGYVVGSFFVNRHNEILIDNLSLSIDKQGRIGFVYKF